LDKIDDCKADVLALGFHYDTGQIWTPTKTTAEGQNISAWNATRRLGWASLRQRDWREEQEVPLANGEKSTDSKQALRHHLDGYHWKNAPRGRNRRLLCESKGRGLMLEGLPAGQGGAKCGLGATHIGIQRTLSRSEKEAR
jgi:hypothetical protein